MIVQPAPDLALRAAAHPPQRDRHQPRAGGDGRRGSAGCWAGASSCSCRCPPALLAGSAGVWLFYVQHQFEDAYWESADDWSYADAALRGSSYLKLPKVLQFFTGNIGLHHVHHLSARIPNYNLQRAHDANPIFHDVPDALALGWPAHRAAQAVGRGARAAGDLRAGALRLSRSPARRWRIATTSSSPTR